MKSLIFVSTIVLFVLTSVRSLDTTAFASALSSQFKNFVHSRRGTKEGCYAEIIPYPLKGMGIEQGNDNTSESARSYFKNFSLKVSEATRGNERSRLEVAIEYKSPELIPISKQKVAVNFYNLLFTVSLLTRKRNPNCRNRKLSRFGFVELVETDTTWYKKRYFGDECQEQNLENDDVLYVMKKPTRHIFAHKNFAQFYPISRNYILPLKYESSEQTTVDFETHSDTLEYEKLIRKKIFLVQANQYDKVMNVIAGIDVMIYLDYVTHDSIDSVHLTLNTNHSLIQWIVHPEKYLSILNDLKNHEVRGSEDNYKCKRFPNPSVTTLNPLPDSVHVYTE